MSEADGSNETPMAPSAVVVVDETTVRASIVVHAPIERAFQVFTEGMSSWWPREHHIGRVPMVATIVEPRIGGRWYELGDDGSECDWGVVLAWDPPHHVAVSWHLDGDYRYDADARRSSRVDVRFQPQGDGTTLVELEHSGLDHHGPTWRRLRDDIASAGGWPGTLRRFADTAGS